MKQSILRRPAVQTVLALFIVVFVAISSSHTTWARGKHTASSGTATEVPLLEGLFALDFPITTDSKKAQAQIFKSLPTESAYHYFGPFCLTH